VTAQAAGGAKSVRSRVITWRSAALAAVLVALFVSIAAQAAVDGRLVSWDVQVTETMVAARTSAWNWVLWAFTLLGNTPMMAMLTVAAAGLLFMRGRRSRAVLVAAAVLSATGVSQLLKAVLQRIRPPEVLALIDVPGSYSLPSGHALVTSVFLGLLVALALRPGSSAGRVLAGVGAVVVGGVIGFSRIYLGVHWASDVIAGWCVAGIWLTVLLWTFRAWQRSDRALGDVRPWRDGRARAAVSVGLALAVVGVFILTALTDPLLV
jgi:membrane-associated phospholipid phosphatase